MSDPELDVRDQPFAPFALAAALPFLLVLLPGPAFDPWLTIAGAVATVAIFGVVVVVPWSRISDLWMALPAFAYFGVVGLLREAAGGTSSGLGPMVLLPVIAVALFGSRRALSATIAGVAVVYWLPIVVGGASRYPEWGWRIGAVFIALSAILALIIQSLHERVRNQADRLQHFAYIDELTGLPNRRAWEAALASGLAVALRREEPVCIAQIDLDNLKVANDTHGHAAGDEMLTAFGASWEPYLRAGDTLARTGGDEFALLLPACDLAEAERIIDRLRGTGGAACSVGIVCWDRVESGDELTRRADALLYEAKDLGRNQVRVG